MIRPPAFLLRRWDRTGKIPRWAMLLWRRLHWCGELDDLLVIGDKCDNYCGCPGIYWPIAWSIERNTRLNVPLTDEEIDALFEDPPVLKSPKAYEP